jgi:hypothetical protein
MGSRREAAPDRDLLEGFRDEGGAIKARRQVARARFRDEGERDVPVDERCSQTEAHSIGDVGIKESKVERTCEMLMGGGQRSDDADDLVPAFLDNRPQVEGDERFIFEDKNTQDFQPPTTRHLPAAEGR